MGRRLLALQLGSASGSAADNPGKQPGPQFGAGERSHHLPPMAQAGIDPKTDRDCRQPKPQTRLRRQTEHAMPDTRHKLLGIARSRVLRFRKSRLVRANKAPAEKESWQPNREVSMASRTILEATISEFKSSLRGELVRPADAGYDAARKVFNAMIDRRPEFIVRCAGVSDVIAAVNFARAQNLLVAIRGAGHNVAGSSVCDAARHRPLADEIGQD
jgi:hypothetical protein